MVRRDALRAGLPQSYREQYQRPEGARAGPERGLGALPGGEYPGDALDAARVAARRREGRRSALLGASTVASSPGRATPVRSGTKPSRQTPPEAALAVRLLRFTGNGSLALLAATVVVSALIEAAEPGPRGLLSRFLSN
jgi:hypothetical protein